MYFQSNRFHLVFFDVDRDKWLIVPAEIFGFHVTGKTKPKKAAAAYGKRLIMRVLTHGDDDMGLQRSPRNASGAPQRPLITKNLSAPAKTLPFSSPPQTWSEASSGPPQRPLINKHLSDPSKRLPTSSPMLQKNWSDPGKIWNHKRFQAKASPALNPRKPRSSEPKDLYNYLMNQITFRSNKQRTDLNSIRRDQTFP